MVLCLVAPICGLISVRAFSGCAHLEYVRGIENPIGIKVGPGLSPDELVELVRFVEPQNRPGRVTLVSRWVGRERTKLARRLTHAPSCSFGCQNVASMLPPLIEAVKSADLRVIWICDPMHGNTHLTEKTNIKTRSFDAILSEVEQTFQVHKENRSRLNGLHFELTGEDVTECVGGPQNLDESDVPLRYTTYCDPRLNYFQSMEISFRVAQLIESPLREQE